MEQEAGNRRYVRMVNAMGMEAASSGVRLKNGFDSPIN
jgi:hypothetical protein